MQINFKIGRTRYWFSSRADADRQLVELQERINILQAEAKRLTKLHSDMRKAIEAVSQ